MNKTAIEWADSTWNPVTGCLHGCEYCYARDMAHRFAGCYDKSSGENIRQNENGVVRLETNENIKYKTKNGNITTAPYPFGFAPTFHRYRLNEYANKKGRTIFVCSMADLFGEWVPDGWIEEVFKACEAAPQHRYLFLTKNQKRYVELADKGKLPKSHWYGYTATKESELWQVKHADEIPIKNLFVSIEPIHGEITIPFSTHCPADWVIIGAESGKRKGKVIPERKWIENIVDVCKYSGRPVFMKNSLADIWGEPLIQEFPW